MAIMGLLNFALHFLAWPVIALGYPLFASIRAVETGSKYHLRKLVIYWTLFALISLFEFVFAKIIEWIPFWSSIRLVVIFWLVVPQFDGACHAYQSLVRAVLLVNLQAVVDALYMPKEEKPRKRETFLGIVEDYIKENGSEALEKLIAGKLKEPDAAQHDKETLEATKSAATEAKRHKHKECQDIQVLEAEEKNAAATSKQLKEPNATQHDNETLEAAKKSAVSEAKQVQSKTAAWVPKTVDATAVNVKETIPPEASADVGPPETPPIKKVQQEWICDLCKVKTSNEKTLNAHLQGRKHKDNCESLKAIKLNAEDTGPSTPSVTGKSGHGNVEFQTDAAAAKVKETTPPEASAENRPLEAPPIKIAQQEWSCDLCKVKTTSEKTLNAHLQGSKHKSNYASLKARKHHADSPSAAGKLNQGKVKDGVKNKGGQGPEQKSSERYQFQAKPKQYGGANQIFNGYCSVCDVKLLSDIDLAAHVAGKRHLTNVKTVPNLKAVFD